MTLKTFSTHMILFAIGMAFGIFTVIQYHELPNTLWYYVAPIAIVVLFSVLYLINKAVSKKVNTPE